MIMLHFGSSVNSAKICSSFASCAVHPVYGVSTIRQAPRELPWSCPTPACFYCSYVPLKLFCRPETLAAAGVSHHLLWIRTPVQVPCCNMNRLLGLIIGFRELTLKLLLGRRA